MRGKLDCADVNPWERDFVEDLAKQVAMADWPLRDKQALCLLDRIIQKCRCAAEARRRGAKCASLLIYRSVKKPNNDGKK